MARAFLAKFFIDVGGTFTDCLAQIGDQPWRLEKFLSSSMIQGRGLRCIDAQKLALSGLTGSADFFRGFQFTIMMPSQEKATWSSFVTAYDPLASEIHLADPIPVFSTEKDDQITWYLKSPEISPIFAIRSLLDLRLDEAIPPVELRLGTTLATNALLEGKGCRLALITTAGFEDLPLIGDQTRPQLFSLKTANKPQIFEEAFGIEEWVHANGQVIESISHLDQLQTKLIDWQQKGIDSLAVCLKNSYRQPIHEQIIAKLARSLGFPYIVCSHEVAAVQKFYERMQTCLLEAYLNPVLDQFIQGLKTTLAGSDLKFMTSFGGLVEENNFTAKDSVLSGPAGGAIGAIEVARELKRQYVVAFDMGGTSTDISLVVDERISLQDQHSVSMPPNGHQFIINQPALAIDTVAAGGGSICWYDGVQLRVGPESAGSDPGPACYGRGGPLTVTDLNVYLGRIAKQDFNFPLDEAAIIKRLDELQEKLARNSQKNFSREDLASGLLQIAIETMAGPIRKMAGQQGYNLNHFSLLSFGGSGSQLALDLAETLGIGEVITSPLASVLSAYGIGVAPNKLMQRFHIPQKLQGGERTDDLRDFIAEKITSLSARFSPDNTIISQYLLEIRYEGQDHLLTLLPSDLRQIGHEFAVEHKRLFGFTFPGRGIEIRQLIVELSQIEQRSRIHFTDHSRPNTPNIKIYWDRKFHSVTSVSWAELASIKQDQGPLMVRCPGTALFIKEAWRWRYHEQDLITVENEKQIDQLTAHDWNDPIKLSLMSHKLMTVAEEMGAQLARTAVSVNIKERRDFSCAIFDSHGNLLVNAPHVPVHLGAMSETIRYLLQCGEKLEEGDVWLCNHPYLGGSHLPDVTVITPILHPQTGSVAYFVANRAHHAEIGGITPGSMPAKAKLLEEEGVILPFMRLVHRGEFCETTIRTKLLSGPFPSRAADENLADFRAQVAANQLGKQSLTTLFPPMDSGSFDAFASALISFTAKRVREVLMGLPHDHYSFVDKLDGGAQLCVNIRKKLKENSEFQLVFDFTGCSPQQDSNLNANQAITRAVVMYGLRCLLDEDIPLNEGVLEPIAWVIPSASILSPEKTAAGYPAVVGGNVEISQRLCDLILAAFGISAASQGTMNNITLGGFLANRSFRFYETIGGGMGGNWQSPGGSATQVHMTNTRITDVEVLEERFPVRMRAFYIRRNSGGAGKHPGGDGLCREIECLAPMEVSLLTERRQQAPFGLRGGQSGAKGENLLWHHAEARWETLPSACQRQLHPGDRLRILSPGGGGYGSLDF